MVTGQFGFMFTSSRFHIHVYQLCSTLCKKKMGSMSVTVVLIDTYTI